MIISIYPILIGKNGNIKGNNIHVDIKIRLKNTFIKITLQQYAV